MGMTLVCLRELGRVPILEDQLISWDKGIDKCFLKYFKILVGTLFGPTAL